MYRVAPFLSRCFDHLPTSVEHPAASLRSKNGDRMMDRRLKALAALAVRRHICAGDKLFAEGDPAETFLGVETGELLAYRSSDPSPSSLMSRQQMVCRLIRPGELFILECDGVRVANCRATTDSRILSIDRGRLERLAVCNTVLRRELAAIHARELEWILQGLGGTECESGVFPSFAVTQTPPQGRRPPESDASARAARRSPGPRMTGGMTAWHQIRRLRHPNIAKCMRFPMTDEFHTMSAMPTTEGEAYDPESLATIDNAFNAAWERIASTFGDDPVAIKVAREELARVILSAAHDTTRDAEALQRSGLQAMERRFPEMAKWR